VSPFWGDKESLNEKLLREGGFGPDGMPLEGPVVDEEPDPILGLEPARKPAPARWTREPHVIATVEAPELEGDSYAFTALPDSSLVVDDSCEEDLSRLADAVEEQLSPPYGAESARHGDGSWTVAAWPIKVSRFVADGDELQLTSVGGERTYTVDGEDASGAPVPRELIRLGESRSEDYAVHASRLDEDLWEMHVNPL
jgi:hypothetical protein